VSYSVNDQVTYFSTRFVCLIANTGEYPLPIGQYWLAVPNPTVAGGYTSLNPTATTFDFSLLQTSWINSLDPSIILPWVDDGGGVVAWSYGTVDPVVLGDQTTDSGTPNTTGLSGTTFDGGSLQFIAPVDMYTNTNEFNRYLAFPRRDIITPVGTLPLSFIPWTEDDSIVTWIDDVTDSGPVTWTTLEP
jgi:hypothetical protein